MPHPYVIVNGKFFAEMSTYLQETLVAIALNDGVSEEAVAIWAAQYADVVNKNRQHVFEITARKITEYINFHQVQPKDGVYDEFKGIYFIGMAITDCLLATGLVDLNKFHQRAMLRLLDLRLEFPHKAYRKVLSERVRKTIENHCIEPHFGKYGWYITYKCLFNAANEKALSSQL